MSLGSKYLLLFLPGKPIPKHPGVTAAATRSGACVVHSLLIHRILPEASVSLRMHPFDPGYGQHCRLPLSLKMICSKV